MWVPSRAGRVFVVQQHGAGAGCAPEHTAQPYGLWTTTGMSKNDLFSGMGLLGRPPQFVVPPEAMLVSWSMLQLEDMLVSMVHAAILTCGCSRFLWMSVFCAATRTQMDVRVLCCHRRLCLRPCGLYCCLKLCTRCGGELCVCPRSVLSLDTMVRSVIRAAADRRGRGSFFASGIVLTSADSPLRMRDIEASGTTSHPALPPNKNNLDRKPLKKVLKNVIGMLGTDRGHKGGDGPGRTGK